MSDTRGIVRRKWGIAANTAPTTFAAFFTKCPQGEGERLTQNIGKFLNLHEPSSRLLNQLQVDGKPYIPAGVSETFPFLVASIKAALTAADKKNLLNNDVQVSAAMTSSPGFTAWMKYVNAYAVNELFDENGEVRNAILFALNEDEKLREHLATLSDDEKQQFKIGLLSGYISNIIGPLAAGHFGQLSMPEEDSNPYLDMMRAYSKYAVLWTDKIKKIDKDYVSDTKLGAFKAFYDNKNISAEMRHAFEKLVNNEKENLKKEFENDLERFYRFGHPVNEAFNWRKSISKKGQHVVELNEEELAQALKEIDANYEIIRDEEGFKFTYKKEQQPSDYELMFTHRPIRALKKIGFSNNTILSLKPSEILTHDATLFYAITKLNAATIEVWLGGMPSEERITSRKEFIDSAYPIAKAIIVDHHATDDRYTLAASSSSSSSSDDEEVVQEASPPTARKFPVDVSSTAAVSSLLNSSEALPVSRQKTPEVKADDNKKEGFFARHPIVKYTLIAMGVGLLMAAAAASIVLGFGFTTPIVLFGLGGIVSAVTGLSGMAAMSVGAAAIVAGTLAVSSTIGAIIGSVVDLFKSRDKKPVVDVESAPAPASPRVSVRVDDDTRSPAPSPAPAPAPAHRSGTPDPVNEDAPLSMNSSESTPRRRR